MILYCGNPVDGNINLQKSVHIIADDHVLL